MRSIEEIMTKRNPFAPSTAQPQPEVPPRRKRQSGKKSGRLVLAPPALTFDFGEPGIVETDCPVTITPGQRRKDFHRSREGSIGAPCICGR